MVGNVPLTVRIGRLSLCFALGAATTVALSWALALRMVVPVLAGGPVVGQGLDPDAGHDPDGGPGRLQRAWWCQIKRSPGLTVVAWEPVILRWRPGPLALTGDVLGEPEREEAWVMRASGRGQPVRRVTEASWLEPDDVPGWARRRADVTWALPGLVVHAASARGWPLRALWYDATIVRRTRTNVGGIDLPAGLRWLGDGPVLPFRVIPAGFVVDTVFYGAVWMGLLYVPGAVRRSRRRRRGLCPHCGYDLAHAEHDACPECGNIG